MKSLQKVNVSLPLAVVLATLWVAMPALAHHPFGAQTPANFWQGLLSGLGHPIIGLDHVVGVVALGLLATRWRWGIVIPIGFIASTLMGTGLHLMALNLPAVETTVSVTVLISGILLAVAIRPSVGWVAGVALFAGLFHGYAYGETIIGAERSPLIAYLIGFSTVQLAIAAVSYRFAQIKQMAAAEQAHLNLRFAGFAVAGFGAALLTTLWLG
ncbi:MAG: HupE/UreJ family protein [Almyronema sp.]